ncbi:TPA: hypothetical protein I7752_03895 [Vibrio vulnificus]|nr:hypothetical protein [Vibrio vulnificus]
MTTSDVTRCRCCCQFAIAQTVPSSLLSTDQCSTFRNSYLVTPQEILAGIALQEIAAPDDIRTSSKLLKYARAICKIKGL